MEVEHRTLLKKLRWQLPLLALLMVFTVWEGRTMTVGRWLVKLFGLKV